MNPTQTSIMQRRSTRGFTPAALTQTEIQNLMDAALASPTAKNYQDWHFTFVRNQELLDAFNEDFIKRFNEARPDRKKNLSEYHVFFHAPLAIFITLPEKPNSGYAQVDAGIAVENLALAAQGMGLGNVILGYPGMVFSSEDGPKWEKRFQFPEGHHFAIAIVIGHNTVTKEAHPVQDNKITFVD